MVNISKSVIQEDAEDDPNPYVHKGVKQTKLKCTKKAYLSCVKSICFFTTILLRERRSFMNQ